MKTKVELLGFDIEIEEVDGKLEIKAKVSEEVVEELSLDPSEYDVEEVSDVDVEVDVEGEELPTEEEEIKSFDEFDEGDEEVADEEVVEEEEEEDEDEEEDEECDKVDEAVKSFDKFFVSKK